MGRGIKMEVYGYVRISTKSQIEGYGIQTQEAAIKEYCLKNNCNLIEVFKDEGISGSDFNRDGLTEMLSNLKGGQKILVLNTSRLWRSDAVKVLVQRELIKKSSDVLSVEQPTYSIYSKDPNDFLINGLMELLDQFERMSITLKLSAGRRTKAKLGSKACGNAPIGYRWNEHAEIVLDEKQAEVVALIFKKYLEIGSLEKLKRYLKIAQIKTNRGNDFSKQALAEILKNDFYKGVLRHSDLVIAGNHPPIVNKIVFGKVQALLKRNRRGRVEHEQRVE